MKHCWKLPLSARSEAEFRICGGPLTAVDFETLRKYVDLIDDAVTNGHAPALDEIPKVDSREIVQLKSTADPVFGGLLLRVKEWLPDAVRGYLLVAHRGGCREAWWTAKHCQIEPIGRLKSPEAEFGFHAFKWVRNGNKVIDLWQSALE